MYQNAVLVLEDGTSFQGKAIGVDGYTVGEVVFNTSMTGYQEIISDPSYCQQIITLTYPHIGNTGTNPDDDEADRVFAQGLIIRNLPLISSNWRNKASLSDYLKQHNIIAIADIDTRKLTRLLRDKGAQKGCIAAGKSIDLSLAVEKAKKFSGLKGQDLAQLVTTERSYSWNQSSWTLSEGYENSSASDYHIVAYDFGVKKNILRLLVDRQCKITVVPAKTTAQKVLELKPDGIFLSNGPGDPEPCEYAIAAIKTLMAHNIPMFGICLGHQLFALACGAKTIKMKFGHHGANHPVQNVVTKEVMITSQNHGFMVDEKSLPDCLEITHRSLFDKTLQGIRHKEKPIFSFQGHPEASPGPQDIVNLFDDFMQMMKK